MLVTRQTKIGQLIKDYPQAKTFLLMNGLHCAGCAANSFDTLESGGRIHRWPESEIDLLVEELNKYLLAVNPNDKVQISNQVQSSKTKTI